MIQYRNLIFNFFNLVQEIYNISITPSMQFWEIYQDPVLASNLSGPHVESTTIGGSFALEKSIGSMLTRSYIERRMMARLNLAGTQLYTR